MHIPLSDMLFGSVAGQMAGPCWNRHSLIAYVIPFHKRPSAIRVNYIRHMAAWDRDKLKISVLQHLGLYISFLLACSFKMFWDFAQDNSWFFPRLAQLLPSTSAFFKLPSALLVESGLAYAVILSSRNRFFCLLRRAEASGGWPISENDTGLNKYPNGYLRPIGVQRMHMDVWLASQGVFSNLKAVRGWSFCCCWPACSITRVCSGTVSLSLCAPVPIIKEY